MKWFPREFNEFTLRYQPMMFPSGSYGHIMVPAPVDDQHRTTIVLQYGPEWALIRIEKV